MPGIDVNWVKCQGEVWCPLSTVNLDHAHFDNMHGVYIIWHGGSSSATVYVGKGFIRDRIASHRTDPEIQAFAALGLYVTWASVPEGSIDGVVSYLEQRLLPKATEINPHAPPSIEINLPW
jgi:hypothetical protein